jgi:hypothetical protein
MASRGNALVRRPAVVFGLVIAHEPLAGDAHGLAADGLCSCCLVVVAPPQPQQLAAPQASGDQDGERVVRVILAPLVG